jgi:hypothetical protein
MLALKHDQSHNAEVDPAAKVTSLASTTPRRMHVLTLKDIPLSSSAKAPFGTDNNVYIKGMKRRGDEDPIALKVLENSLDGHRRAYGAVTRANDVFRESAEDDSVSVISEAPSEVPPHLRTSMNPITGEEYLDAPSARRSACSSRRMSESHIEAGQAGFVSNDSNGLDTHRKHFKRISTPNPTEWNPDVQQPTEAAENYATQLGKRSIISHDPHLPPLPYRPQTRTVERPTSCPFATDADDLAEMRRRLLRTPLGKTVA